MDIWRKLLDRLEPLKSADLEGVTGWVWQDKQPCPLCTGGLRYFLRESEYLIRDGDLWVDLPLRGAAERDAYRTGSAYAPPDPRANPSHRPDAGF